MSMVYTTLSNMLAVFFNN